MELLNVWPILNNGGYNLQGLDNNGRLLNLDDGYDLQGGGGARLTGHIQIEGNEDQLRATINDIEQRCLDVFVLNTGGHVDLHSLISILSSSFARPILEEVLSIITPKSVL